MITWRATSGSFTCPKHGKHWVVLLNPGDLEVHRTCSYRDHWAHVHTCSAIIGMTRLLVEG